MKTKIVIISVAVAITALLLGFFSFIIVLTPKADAIELKGVPESFFISNGTHIDFQESGDCSAYATAYALRCLGKDVSGKDLYPQMKRFLGLMTVQSVKKTIEKQGFQAQGYSGSVDKLKQRIAQDKPVICYVTDKEDSHYAVAVGFDSDYIYLADSIKENTNVENPTFYNRKVTIAEFKNIWKNKWYFCNNIYIVIDGKQV